ncbi:two-component regulator propeller domain-containing protein [Fodinibius saliphilus]|uniref:two-component regulator propeller domain-containing protein n=1 Tax=Fodinibius saliphilus TaxID=1920650 RepID=UPI00110839FC|nr:two-component regulator propeller domain-containing protein [Fodinibius saliphilus]
MGKTCRVSRVLRKYFLIGLVIGLFPSISYSQQYNLESFSVNKGLPHSQVSDITQTTDGFVWIGTYGGGITKFDGKNFQNYSTQEGLKTNVTEVIYEDSKKNLWIGTHGHGPMKLEADSIVSVFDGLAIDTTTVLKISEPQENGEVWFGTIDAGVFIYDGNNLKKLTTDNGLIDNTVWDFWESSDGIIWLATQRGISRFDGKTFDNVTTEDGLSGTRTFEFMQAEDGRLWIATDSGISIWDGQGFSTIEKINGTRLGFVFDLLASSDGSIWIATDKDGIFKYKDGTFSQISTRNGLSENSIYELYEDRYNNIWIGTYNNGIDIYQGHFAKFYGREMGLSSQKVTSIYFDKNNRKWVGTFEGLSMQDGDIFKSLSLPQNIENRGEVWEIAELENGNLLFSMPNYMIYEYDGNTYQNYSERHNLPSLIPYELYVDKNNTVWIGSNKGVFHITGKGVEQYTTDTGLPSNVVYQVFEHNRYKWIATQGGISRFDGENFKNYTNKDGLHHQEVRFITSDDDENLWVGTSGGVSFLTVGENGTISSIENIKKSDGLKLTKTQLLWFDEEGHLWQGTNGGLHKINVAEFQRSGNVEIEHYRLSDVGIGVETNHKAIQKISPHKVWVGTMNGILELDTQKMHSKKGEIPVYITDIERNATSIKGSDFADILEYQFGRPVFQNLEFPYGQHTYTFNYLSPSFGSDTDITYRHKLKGFENKWSQPSEMTQATFTSLAPGDYTFQVQAIIGNSSQVVNEASVRFVVENPFWQTYWFYAVVFLAFVGLVYTYIQFRVHKIEKDRLKELVDEQTKDLTEALEEKEVLIKEIHHRVKNNLAVISGLLELQVGHTEDEFSSRILSESQRRVQSISMIHEKLYQSERLAEIKVEKYVKELISYISYSFNNPEKSIEVKTEIDEFKLGVDQGIPCGLILNELVSNAYEHAFKNSDQGIIQIKIQEDSNRNITFSVSDNGCGVDENYKEGHNQSLGLTLVETLCEQLNGNWKLENTGDGTRFVLHFKKEEASLRVPVS